MRQQTMLFTRTGFHLFTALILSALDATSDELHRSDTITAHPRFVNWAIGERLAGEYISRTLSSVLLHTSKSERYGFYETVETGTANASKRWQ
jgi:hypothetical protein